jgi:tripartite-type tricarboxylate transporter receptor subunit TctC
MSMRRLAGLVFALIGLTAAVAPAGAQSWPNRAVKLIVPLGPGAGSDIGARMLADRLSKKWGQPVVVENRAGGDAIPALVQFTGANDDHTFLFAPTSTFIAHPLQYPKLQYDPADLVPIVQVSITVISVTVPASLPVSSLVELADLARKQPGKLNWHAVTSLNDLQFQAFLKVGNLDMVRVPYRDGIQALNDLAESRIQVYSSAFAVARPQVQAGKVKVIALTNTRRSELVPGVSTTREQGHPALEFDGLIGAFGTRVVSAAVRDKLSADVLEFMKDKEIVDRLTATGQIVAPGDAAAFSASMATQKAGAEATAKILGMKMAQ